MAVRIDARSGLSDMAEEGICWSSRLFWRNWEELLCVGVDERARPTGFGLIGLGCLRRSHDAWGLDGGPCAGEFQTSTS